jgi:hypothetical protein
MSTPSTLLGQPPVRRRITIPANTGLGASVRALLEAAGYNGDIAAFQILATDSAGTTRSAFVVASPLPGVAAVEADFTTHGQYVPAGVDHYAPPSEGAANSLVRSASASAITAVALVLA